MGNVKLTFIGDIMCTNNMMDGFCTNGVFDFGNAFSQTKELFSNSNIVIGNLETPVSLSNSNLSKEPFSFCAPIEFVKALKSCGINGMSTANNHCLDRGVKGVFSTIDSLDRVGIQHTGTRKKIHEKNYISLNFDGLRIAILSYTYGTNAFSNGCYLTFWNALRVNLFQAQELFCRIGKYVFDHPASVSSIVLRRIYKRIIPRNKGKEVYEHDSPSIFRRICMNRTIAKARRKSDFVIMCLHTGGQFNSEESNRTVLRVQKLYKKGVNIVIANHEHIIHKIDREHVGQGQVAAYCLGDFFAPYGVIEGPYNKYANYSIALNIYISPLTKEIEKVSYNILQTIKHDGYLKVVDTFDLFGRFNQINDERRKSKELEILDVSGKTGYRFDTIKNEYIIYDISGQHQCEELDKD